MCDLAALARALRAAGDALEPPEGGSEPEPQQEELVRRYRDPYSSGHPVPFERRPYGPIPEIPPERMVLL